MKSKEFSKLPLRGGFVREVQLWLGKKASLSIVVPPGTGRRKQLTRDYDLHFGLVGAVHVDVKALPTLEIVSLQKVQRSALFDEFKSQVVRSGPALTHYCLKFAEGQLDLLAGSFDLNLVAVLPHVPGSR